ncbi:zinc finger protein 585A-like isoform X2 [Erpetoichthys calabaricus]|uniref:zinc finger protein 585A-like isoform X2 n=1 Tax=Erpetoichthys calabaricus TaxID=27687 RepID=UPI002234C398|nr:zinc finger protein 585A-like isoform X2 [Erpetoichthys calabaricus]
MADVDASAGSPAVNDCSIELDCVAQPPSLLETVPDVQIINADGVEIKVEQIEHGRSEGVDSDADHESTVPRSVSKEPNPGVGTEIKVEEEYMEVKVCEVGESSEDGTLCKQEGASNDENNSGDGPFQCLDCGETFTLREAYESHLKVHSLQDLPEKEVPSLSSFTSKGKPYTCPECGKGYLTMTWLKNHQRQHIDRTVITVSDHEKTNENKPIECAECGERFSRIAALQTHQQRHDKSQTALNKPFKCTCGKQYSCLGSLLNHKRYSSCAEPQKSREEHKEVQLPNEKPLKCHVRLPRVRLPPFLQNQLSDINSTETCGNQPSESKEKRYVCECGKGYSSFSWFETHQKSHLKEKKTFSKERSPLGSFECPECKKSFSRSAAFQNHMKRHAKSEAAFDKPWQKSLHDETSPDRLCKSAQSQLITGSENGMKFTYENELLSNQQSHDIPEPPRYRCSCCCKVFDSLYQLRAHKKRLLAKCISCPSCSFTCKSKKQLIHHLACHESKSHKRLGAYSKQNLWLSHKDPESTCQGEMETSQQGHVCLKCKRIFTSLQRLQNHEKLRSKKHFRCALCCKSYREEGKLERHISSHGQKQHSRSSPVLSKPASNLGRSASYWCIVCGKQFMQKSRWFSHCKRCGEQSGVPESLQDGKPIYVDNEQQGEHQESGVKIDEQNPGHNNSVSNDGGEISMHKRYKRNNETFQTNRGGFLAKTFKFRKRLKVRGGLVESTSNLSPASDESKALVCPECGESFSRMAAFQAHQQRHAEAFAALDKPYTCECGKGYQSPGALYTHKKTHAILKLSADYTGISPLNKMKPRSVSVLENVPQDALPQSQIIDSTDVSSDLSNFPAINKKRFSCSYCGKGYFRLTWLQAHQRSHVNVQPSLNQNPDTVEISSENTELGKHFSKSTSFKMRHKNVPKRRIVRNKSRRSNTLSSSLNTHKKDDLDVKFKDIDNPSHNLTCLECGLYFQDDVELKVHSASCPSQCQINPGSETGVSNKWKYRRRHFSCPICSKIYFKEGRLKQHLAGHKRQRPLVCLEKIPDCPSPPSHTHSHHGTLLSQTEPEQVESMSDGSRHIQAPAEEGGSSQDSSEKAVQLSCNICEKVFIEEFELYLHLIQHATGHL